MEENLEHSSLEFLKVLEKYTLESKMLACQKFSSRIMTSSKVDMLKAYEENIMPWERHLQRIRLSMIKMKQQKT